MIFNDPLHCILHRKGIILEKPLRDVVVPFITLLWTPLEQKLVGLLEKSFFVPFHFNITLINFIILYKIWLLKNIMKDSGFIISIRSVTNGLKSGEFLFYNNSFCFVTAVYSSFLVTLLALVFRKKPKNFQFSPQLHLL